ncbi:hypothetical protein B0T22DRAFT_482192 [Podospora appendiculata]|uniref:Uncharacterized protein n=1 Tax=Podospora appendiculata TaxID=314037 RepID=A0AAE1CA31_9PEZI|nr:hypothetical protein B0T22DRAFT_482192 [Podospora appendiculata]
MPIESHHHHRSRSSIDRVFDLLADLQDSQIALLLDDLNHTTSSNVPVSQAIALFDPSSPKPKPKRNIGRSSSPVRALQVELERRHSKRISSALEMSRLPRTASQPSMQAQMQRPTSPSIPEHPRHDQSTTIITTITTTATTSRPSLSLTLPESPERPRTATERTPDGSRSRSYKRVSRPLFLSPTATAELNNLLLAYLYNDPVSATTTATPSPNTPTAPTHFSPFFSIEPEPDTPGLDLLEPSHTRLPDLPFGKRGLVPKDSMSSIFEVLASH